MFVLYAATGAHNLLEIPDFKGNTRQKGVELLLYARDIY